MAVVETKYSLGTYILFSIIVVTLVAFAELIFYNGNPPKRPYRKRRRLPLNHPLFITALIIGISSLILLNTLYK